MAVADTAKLVASLELKDKFSKPAADAEKAMGRLEKKSGTLGKTLGKGLSSAWKNTERGIVIGAGAAAGALAYSASKAIAWEDAFAGVKKTINESDLKTVGLNFTTLGDKFRDMARNMPVAAEDLAHIGEAAGALGIRAGDILTFTDVVAKLAVTTDLTDETASDALGHLGNVLHLTGNDFKDLADSLVALGNNGASTESQIIAIAERFGAAGNSAGLAKEDILALASTTASMGIEVEAGGSALARVFNGIATNIGTGSAKAKAFAKTLGISAAEFKKAWARDALGTFQDFLAQLNKMDQFDAAATLKSIGITNTRDVNAIRLLASGYKELNKQIDVSRHAAGAMDKEAQQRFATTKSQLQILKNNADDAAITIGSALLPKINELATKATDWLRHHQPEVKRFAQDIAAGFEKAVTWASKLDWNAIGNTLKTVGGVGKTLLETFLHMPSWVQVAVATGWGLNKFTGGAVGTLVGELGKGLIKGVLGMNAGVVNIKAGVVNGGGGVGPGGTPVGAPGKTGLGKVLDFASKALIVGLVADLAQETHPMVQQAAEDVHDAVFSAIPKIGIDQLQWPFGPKNTPTILPEVFGGNGLLGGMPTAPNAPLAPVPGTLGSKPIPVKDAYAAGVTAHGASEHNEVIRKAMTDNSNRITAEIVSHAASERADLRKLDGATAKVPLAIERLRKETIQKPAQQQLPPLFNPDVTLDPTQVIDRRTKATTQAFDRGAAKASRDAIAQRVATLRVGDRIGLLRTATVDQFRTSHAIDRQVSSRTAQAVERMRAVESVSRATAANTDAIRRKNFSPTVDVNVHNAFSISNIINAQKTYSYVTATGRVGGLIR